MSDEARELIYGWNHIFLYFINESLSSFIIINISYTFFNIIGYVILYVIYKKGSSSTSITGNSDF
jgi:hypothetical protein